MDRLRALRYLEAAAQEHSFSAAARRFDVSVAAVAKLINSLEGELGVVLVERHARGLRMTPDGASYLEACVPALRTIDAADERTRSALTRARGRVVVGIQHVIARGLLTSALPRFHERHPEIELDVRDLRSIAAEPTSGFDVMLVLGWPKRSEDLVHRVIAASRFTIAAAPSYWAEHGLPARPLDLERHACLPIRTPEGEVMNLWAFRRHGAEESAQVRGWITTSNAHRDLVVDLALAGHGVVRLLDWTNRDLFASGRLVPTLVDWESLEAIPVNLFYPPSARRLPRVRAFIDFAVELFRGAGGIRPAEAGERSSRRPRSW